MLTVFVDDVANRAGHRVHDGDGALVHAQQINEQLHAAVATDRCLVLHCKGTAPPRTINSVKHCRHSDERGDNTTPLNSMPRTVVAADVAQRAGARLYDRRVASVQLQRSNERRDATGVGDAILVDRCTHARTHTIRSRMRWVEAARQHWLLRQQLTVSECEVAKRRPRSVLQRSVALVHAHDVDEGVHAAAVRDLLLAVGCGGTAFHGACRRTASVTVTAQSHA